MAITRTSMTDDDGTGTTGTVINAAWKTELYDQLDAWVTGSTSYTPTLTNLTLGNGTMVARYVKVNKMVWMDIQITMGSTTTYGGGSVWAFSLPVTAANTNGQVMNAYMLDSGTAFYVGMAAPVSTTTINVYNNGGTSGIASTLPFTWTTGDVLRISGWYVAA